MFSPDSRTLTYSGACYPDDDEYGPDVELFIVCWTLQTGGVVSVIGWREPGNYFTGSSSITYSANGKMVGVLHRSYDSPVVAKIFICDITSGVCLHSHSFSDEIISSEPIWTCGESLRFATAGSATITIWEVGFTSSATPTEVETISVPDDLNPGAPHLERDSYRTERVQFLPAPCRLVVVHSGIVLVWDVRNSRYLLRQTDNMYHPRMSFSSDNRFFACSTRRSGVYLWKESPTGYILHEKLTSGTGIPAPLLSPNGESIIAFGGHAIRLWHTRGFATPPSSIPTRVSQHLEDFVLAFSPDGALAMFSRNTGSMVTVVDLKSGVPHLTIDASMEVRGVQVIENTAVVIGATKAITWDLWGGARVADARVNYEDSVRTISFNGSEDDDLVFALMSLDFHFIAQGTSDFESLYIYSASSGELLESIEFAMRRVVSTAAKSYRIPLGVGRPKLSCCGYQVASGARVLGPDGKQLLMFNCLLLGSHLQTTRCGTGSFSHCFMVIYQSLLFWTSNHDLLLLLFSTFLYLSSLYPCCSSVYLFGPLSLSPHVHISSFSSFFFFILHET